MKSKYLRNNDLENRCRKRELRIQLRIKRLEQEQKGRTYWNERKDQELDEVKMVDEALLADNKKPRKPDKKSGSGKFLSLYSYIKNSAYDKRHNIPSSWKPHSFNERKQNIEFLRSFVYPYPLPETLLWATHAPEYTYIKTKTPDFVFIRLAKKWINDIVCGDSFYKRNKDFFTKAEAHYFLCSKIPYVNGNSVLKLFFYAKLRARSFNHKLSLMIADVFSVKFHDHFNNGLVTGFLDLLSRAPDYRYERGMLGDISDFVRTKLHRGFSFSGRTIASVIALTNEWHEEMRREAEARQIQHEARLLYGHQQGIKNKKPMDTSHWNGLGIYQFRHESEGLIWTVTELKTAQDLLNEGRKMKNCVASYTCACAVGNSAIFTVERMYPLSQVVEKVATLEVQKGNRALIQAKGKCNTAVTPKAMIVIARWARENRITIRLMV